MNEEQAQHWLIRRYGSAKVDRLDHYVALLLVENDQQNLIAASTVSHILARHIVDSAQLLDLVPPEQGQWIDIGSGAGLPGIVVALLSDFKVALIEPRRLRTEFLDSCIQQLGLGERVRVFGGKVERFVNAPATVISARAVAALPQLLTSAAHLANRETIWVLPKGINAQSEVADARRTWHGTFHVKPSVVDPNSGIVVASDLVPRR